MYEIIFLKVSTLIQWVKVTWGRRRESSVFFYSFIIKKIKKFNFCIYYSAFEPIDRPSLPFYKT